MFSLLPALCRRYQDLDVIDYIGHGHELDDQFLVDFVLVNPGFYVKLVFQVEEKIGIRIDGELNIGEFVVQSESFESDIEVFFQHHVHAIRELHFCRVSGERVLGELEVAVLRSIGKPLRYPLAPRGVQDVRAEHPQCQKAEEDLHCEF